MNFAAVAISFGFFALMGSAQEWWVQNPNQIFSAKTYFDSGDRPQFSDKPVITNGHIGYIPFSASIYMNGLYNGFRETCTYRARIPNFANIFFENCGSSHTIEYTNSSCTFEMDIQRALFATRAILLNGSIAVEHNQYAHRYYDKAIVNTIELKRNTAENNASSQIKMNRNWFGWSDDLDIITKTSKRIGDREVFLISAQTKESEDPEYQKELSKVFILYESLPKSIEIPSGQTATNFTWLTIIQHVPDGIEELFQKMHEDHDDVLKIHVNEWTGFWNENAITAEGNNELTKSIQSSLFALVSTLPSIRSFSDSGDFYSLSPSGVGIATPLACIGHVFWGTEIWMYPAIALFEPIWGEKILNYRHLGMKAARDNARNTGYKGLRYPRESAFTGAESTLVRFPQNIKYQQHITSDIGYAVRQHFFASHNLEWMKEIGCDIAMGTAEFWASRVTFNESTNRFDIAGIMGPDEDHWNVTNNAYTNVGAALNLYFGSYASCICNKLNARKYSVNNEWAEIASQIRVPYDARLDYNPQYDGFNLSTTIKQADAALLGYPLQYANLKASTRRNNLKFYRNLTRNTGPAMTWSMHAIGYLDAGEMPPDDLFRLTYEPYIRDPYYVWSGKYGSGAVDVNNFITGAGGFLQLMLYGYGGIRINADSMTFKHPRLPPRTKKLQFNGIQYMQTRFRMVINSDSFDLLVRSNSSKFRLFVDGIEQDLFNSIEFSFYQTQKVKILPVRTESALSCPLPRDIIDNA